MVRFGVAGYPPGFKESRYRKDRVEILRWLSDLGLDALELQMTYGPRMPQSACLRYRELSDSLGIALSVHASYFIVFTSPDPTKVARSRETLKRTFELCEFLGAKEVVLHPGPLYGGTSATPLRRFVDNLGDALAEIGKSETCLFVETAGKLGQLGSLQEIAAICKALPGVYPCVDFGHIHARTLGGLESEKNIRMLFEELANGSADPQPSRIHFHYTPIEYGPRGEISHSAINDRYSPVSQMTLSDLAPDPLRSRDGYFHPRVEPIAAGLRLLELDFTVISETHDSQEEGALALKRAFLRARP